MNNLFIRHCRSAAVFVFVLWTLIPPGRADTYVQWKARVFTASEQANAAVSGENACPAGDGVCNLLKFAFDLDPHRNSAARLPTISTVLDTDPATGQQESYAAITYRVPSAYVVEGVTCVPEVAAGPALSTWYRGPGSLTDLGQQAPQNTGDPTLFTCKALSPIRQNPAGLFLRLRVVEGHQLPPDWLQTYFPGATVDPNVDADGDGVSNWQEFLNGTAPTDYYNARVPDLWLVGGGNQRAVAGSLLPQPISIEVNYWGDQNAPLTFTAVGGALLAPNADSAYHPSATVDVRSTGQINVDGSQTYVAQAYVYLPAAANTVSTITATAKTAGRSISVATKAVATDPNLQPPADFHLISNAATSALVGFTPADATLPVSLEVSADGGATWNLGSVTAAGATTATLPDLPAETPLLLRAFTGADPTGAPTGGGSTNSPAPSPGTSPPSASVGCVGYWRPHIVCRPIQQSYIDPSFKGYQTNNRYLLLTRVCCDAGLGTWTDQYDYRLDSGGTAAPAYTWLSGYHTDIPPYSYGGPADDPHRSGGGSDTEAQGTMNQVNSDGSPGGTFSCTLSHPCTLADFRASAEADFPVCPTAFDYTLRSQDNYYNGAFLELTPKPDDTHDDGFFFAGWDLEYTISKLQYALLVNKEPGGRVCIDTVFYPEGASAPTHTLLVWDTQGATQSPVTFLDPVALNDKAVGRYIVTVPTLYAYGHADDANYDGDSVPSTKPDSTAQKHFVTPKAAGGFAQLEARVTGVPDPTRLNQLYRFVVLQDGTDVTDSVSNQSYQFLFVKTDAAAHYVVQLQTNDAAHTVVDTLNVWVVWATTQPVSYAAGAITYFDIGKGGVVQGAEGYLYTVTPTSIFTDDDRPKLDGSPSIPAPGDFKWDGKSALSGGATKHWDASRKVSGTLTLPADVVPEAIPPPVPPSRIDFVSDDLVGNDDAEVKDESNDPYNATPVDKYPSTVPKGALLSVDAPRFILAHAAGTNGEQASWVLDLKEFARLELGGQWYRISDDTEWHINLRLQRSNGKWINDGTTQGPGAP